MLDPVKNFSKEASHFIDPLPDQELTRSFVNFCEKMGTVFEIKDLLLILKTQIPKKFKIGELLLFYESKPLGLRRAYVRHSVFYEEEAKSPWPSVHKISPSSSKHNLYLAKEFGRPFSKSLVIPFSHLKRETSALLFVEMSQWGKHLEALTHFFEKRSFVLNRIFKRALSNIHFTRVSYLWSQLFTHWWEPLAILQNFQVIRLNDSFKKNLSMSPDFLKKKKQSGLVEIKNKIYQIHYYPISQFKNLNPTRILYCQDMTKHFYLKEQLFQSEKMASLYELGKNMAHQLNNPLTGVRSMTQILCQNPELDNFKEELIEVEKAVQRSQKIIENLLSFSQLRGEPKTCNLNQVVEDTLPLLKSMTKDLLLKMELCKQLVEVKGDFSILQQVAYNLILNACQALKENKNQKKACIQISTNIVSKDKAYLKIKDNGPGIPKQNLEKIFQPLWTDKKRGQGTGFGLGIARHFIRQYEGELLVSSKEKEFACFTVLLPLSCSDT